MQEKLLRELHEYIRENNPDLLVTLQEENHLQEYLHSMVASVDRLVEQLLSENKTSIEIEEICLDELTKSLRPSKYNYLKVILEEEFPDDFERLSQIGLLQTELINLVQSTISVFEEFNFSEQNEEDQHLRYSIIGAVYEYLKPPSFKSELND